MRFSGTSNTGRAPGSIFLSYRRDDVPFAVGLVAASLFGAFSRERVFLDTIANRRGFFVVSRLSGALATSAVVVCVIGPAWDDDSHLRRLADAGDLVRWELETALAADIPVVPVVVDRDRELAAGLPNALAPLRHLAPTLLGKGSFTADADRLIRRLRRILDSGDDVPDPQVEQADARDPWLDADLVHLGIDAMLRHVLPLRQQSSRNLEHLVDATTALLPPGEWLLYLATGHLPGKPSGSALVVVTDQAVRIAQLRTDLTLDEHPWEARLAKVLGADLRARRRLGVLDVADVTFRVAGRALPRVEGIFADQAARLTQLVSRTRSASGKTLEPPRKWEDGRGNGRRHDWGLHQPLGVRCGCGRALGRRPAGRGPGRVDGAGKHSPRRVFRRRDRSWPRELRVRRRPVVACRHGLRVGAGGGLRGAGPCS